MMPSEILRRRLLNQQIGPRRPETPEGVVRRLGAMQAQDYAGAKWALAQRGAGISEAAIEQALSEGKILRTHVLCPTWHFVTAEDIRWMLQLTAPRVNAVNATYYRRLELDEAIFSRSREALVRGLRGGVQLDRAGVAAVLQAAGIPTDGALRLPLLLMRAELDGVLCSGARQGKQFTYALLEERAPQPVELDRPAALAELSRRYFISRGPATLKDFAWWSGLTLADARAGVEMNQAHLRHEISAGAEYWFPASPPGEGEGTPAAHLLSTFDEFLISYTDRSASVEPEHAAQIMSRQTFTATILLNGRVVGVWRRTLSRRAVLIEARLFGALNSGEKASIAAAAGRFGDYLGLPVELQLD